jgi:hypothetical protein
MQKAFLTTFGAILIAATTAHMAAAAEHHAHKARATTSEQFRNSNASVPTQPDYSQYGGGISAPAGR